MNIFNKQKSEILDQISVELEILLENLKNDYSKTNRDLV